MYQNFDLKAAIIRRFGSQINFCREVGMMENRVSRLINGRGKPSNEEKALISQKLGMPEHEIFPPQG